MGDLLRFVFMVTTLLAVTLATALQQPEWAHDLGLDPLTEAILPAELRRDPEFERDLERRDQVLKKRLVAKEACIKELLAGRITLLEAAAHFRHLNEQYPVVADMPDFVSESPEEYLCRQVIQWARMSVRERPSTAAQAVVEQLEQDLRQHKQADGSIVLPAMF